MTSRCFFSIGGLVAALSLVALAGAASPARAAEVMSDAERARLVALAKEVAGMPAVVAAVKAQNARKVPLADIQAADKRWMAARGIDPTMRALMDSACSRALKSVQAERKEIAEAFAMDDQGANVCMTNKTSDYWQGDEAKFQKSFGAGAAAVFVDKPAFDESTQTYLVQVSVPVVERGRAIGAITLGVNLERVASQAHK